MRAKTFRLLCHFAGHPGRVISKDELIEAVWPEVSVTEDSLTQAIRDLRRVLGDEAIRTVSRRGYFLDAPNGADTTPEAAGMARKTGTSDPPVIVVLPLQTLSEDSSTAVLVDGMVEEIIQWLGRYGLVEVIARHSAFQCRPEVMPPRKAAERLGADWFVEGTARQTAGTVRLALSLCETTSGRQVWGEGFTLDSTGPEAAIGAIAHRIVMLVMLDTERRVVKPLAARGSASLTTWQHFIAGVAAI
ncbi:MAG: winged helix-turn-helix domain-containing protein, partial [Aestuariivirga sp.]